MRNNWTREELILAFNLYCKIPYGQFNSRNKDVIALAEMLGRTPGAIAYKLVNFVSIDPKQQMLGRKGAKNIGKLDKVIFQEFSDNFDELFIESEELLKNKQIEINQFASIDTEINLNKKGQDTIREIKTRVGQDYFRKLVMSNYSNTCCITGIQIPELLFASYIKPWSKDIDNRLNPTNGLCLSSTFDQAFDKGLITLNQNYEIIFSSELKKYEKYDFYQKEFSIFENKQIKLPMKFLPNIEFVKFHEKNIFRK